MSSDSESEEFYDAEDTPSHGTRYIGLYYWKNNTMRILTPSNTFIDIYRILKDFLTQTVIYLTVNKNKSHILTCIF